MNQVNPLDELYFWWYDEIIRQWVTLYFWPYFVAGNLDDWLSMGITLNGSRPVNLS